MHRLRVTVVALLAVFAVAALGTATASAHEYLELAEAAQSPFSSGSSIFAEFNFTLATPGGPIECRTWAQGPVTNSEHADIFTPSWKLEECQGAGTFTETEGGLSGLRLTTSGKAIASLNISVNWPAPHALCTYSNLRLGGVNSVTGELQGSFTGPLKRTECPNGRERTVLTTTYFHVEAANSPWGIIEDHISAVKGL